MEIKYSGKFIKQYERAKQRKEEIFKYYPDYFEDFCCILGIKTDDGQDINIKEKREEILKKYDSYDEEIKKAFQELIFYNSIKHSFNKNKGTWLEDYIKELFSNNTNFFKIEKSNPWRDNLINKHFLRVPIKINKNYPAFSVFPLKFDKYKKIKISIDYNPTKYLEILYNKEVSKYFDISLDIGQRINKDNYYFFVNLKLIKKVSDEKLIKLLESIGILEKSIYNERKKNRHNF